MKNIFFILILLSCKTVAQDTGPWMIGVYGSPDYTVFASHTFPDFYLPKAGYTIGSTAERKLTERLTFMTGLSFSNRGYRTGDIYVHHDPNGSAGEWIRMRVNDHLLSIPFLVSYTYTIPDKKVAVSVSGGASLNTFIFFKAIGFRNNIKSVNSYYPNYFESLVDLNFGASCNIPVSEKCEFRIGPSFFRDIAYVGNEFRFLDNYYSGLGLRLGVAYSLTKSD